MEVSVWKLSVWKLSVWKLSVSLGIGRRGAHVPDAGRTVDRR
jgi:hypothetical protein